MALVDNQRCYEAAESRIRPKTLILAGWCR